MSKTEKAQKKEESHHAPTYIYNIGPVRPPAKLMWNTSVLRMVLWLLNIKCSLDLIGVEPEYLPKPSSHHRKRSMQTMGDLNPAPKPRRQPVSNPTLNNPDAYYSNTITHVCESQGPVKPRLAVVVAKIKHALQLPASDHVLISCTRRFP